MPKSDNQKTIEERMEGLIKRYAHVAKGSHYVRQEYLRNWSKDGKRVLASIKGGPFMLTGLDNLCKERYMYELKKLTDSEIVLIKHVYDNSPDYVKKMNDRFLNDWQRACVATESFTGTEYEDMARKMKIQAGEDLQSLFESSLTQEIKDCLINCDESFLNDMGAVFNFGIFLFSQYLRTKKQKEKLIENYKKEAERQSLQIDVDPARFWNPLLTILINMAAATLMSAENLHIKFIRSTKGLLMTSDQPIVNIAKNPKADYAKFYYPLTPFVGIVFPVDRFEVAVDDDALIRQMNKVIVEIRDLFVFQFGE